MAKVHFISSLGLTPHSNPLLRVSAAQKCAVRRLMQSSAIQKCKARSAISADAQGQANLLRMRSSRICLQGGGLDEPQVPWHLCVPVKRSKGKRYLPLRACAAHEEALPVGSKFKRVQIKREWQGNGKEKINVLYLEATKPCQGVVLFMQGWGQSVTGYESLLTEGVVEEGVTVVAIGQPGARWDGLKTTQTRIVKDAKQVVRLLLHDRGNGSPLDGIDIGDSRPGGKRGVGLIGHSMGGGLSFALADYITNELHSTVTHLALMSPLPGVVTDYKPEDMIAKLQPGKLAKALIFTAGLDAIVTPEDVAKGIVVFLKRRCDKVEEKYFDLGNHGGYTGELDFGKGDGTPWFQVPNIFRTAEVEAKPALGRLFMGAIKRIGKVLLFPVAMVNSPLVQQPGTKKCLKEHLKERSKTR